MGVAVERGHADSPERQVTMAGESYIYTFRPEVDMTQVEDNLLLATLAAEGLHGRSRIHLDAKFLCDKKSHRVEVVAGCEVGDAISRIFTALLTTTIGERTFQAERTDKAVCT